MKNFIFKSLLLALPIIAYFSFPVWVLWRSGELTTTNEIIKEHVSKKKKSLIGLAYRDRVRNFKLNSYFRRKPEVIALGTSRVMQFRDFFFHQPEKFYNAGGGVEKVKHYKYFIDQISEKDKPKLIIVGLDQWLFNENWDNLEQSNFTKEYSDDFSALKIIASNSFKIYADYFQNKFSLSSLNARDSVLNKIGLNSIVNSNGFRHDGSYYYGRVIKNPDDSTLEDYKFAEVFKRIKAGNKRFEYSKSISKPALEQLEIFIKECKSRNIRLIAFLPPFADGVSDKLQSMGDKYEYMFNLESAIKPLFQEAGFPFYNFSRLASLNSSDKEMLDGGHGSEKVYLRMMIKMIENDSYLMQYTSKDLLEGLYRNSYSDLELIHQKF
jgi:hypothetical protein